MIIFTHIPRTAGSSIHASFQRYFPNRWFVGDGVGVLPEFSKSISAISDRHLYIGGHFGLLDLEHHGISVKNPDLIFSIVRGTVERAVSLYFLVKKRPENFPSTYTAAADKGFDYFYRFSRDNGYYFRNDSCRYLSGTENYESTIEFMEDKIDIVGSVPRIKKFEDALSNGLRRIVPNFSMISERHNAALSDEANKAGHTSLDVLRDTVTSKLAEKIVSDNEDDEKLYEYIIGCPQGVFINGRKKRNITSKVVDHTIRIFGNMFRKH